MNRGSAQFEQKADKKSRIPDARHQRRHPSVNTGLSKIDNTTVKTQLKEELIYETMDP